MAEFRAPQPDVQTIADDLIEDIPRHRPFDLMDTYAFDLPVRVICRVLGIPHDDVELFRAWSMPLVCP